MLYESVEGPRRGEEGRGGERRGRKEGGEEVETRYRKRKRKERKRTGGKCVFNLKQKTFNIFSKSILYVHMSLYKIRNFIVSFALDVKEKRKSNQIHSSITHSSTYITIYI